MTRHVNITGSREWLDWVAAHAAAANVSCGGWLRKRVYEFLGLPAPRVQRSRQRGVGKSINIRLPANQRGTILIDRALDAWAERSGEHVPVRVDPRTVSAVIDPRLRLGLYHREVRDLIVRTLSESKGIRAAGRTLGIPYSSLRDKMTQLGISVSDQPDK